MQVNFFAAALTFLLLKFCNHHSVCSVVNLSKLLLDSHLQILRILEGSGGKRWVVQKQQLWEKEEEEVRSGV